jgi:hypothetical protein
MKILKRNLAFEDFTVYLGPFKALGLSFVYPIVSIYCIGSVTNSCQVVSIWILLFRIPIQNFFFGQFWIRLHIRSLIQIFWHDNFTNYTIYRYRLFMLKYKVVTRGMHWSSDRIIRFVKIRIGPARYPAGYRLLLLAGFLAYLAKLNIYRQMTKLRL